MPQPAEVGVGGQHLAVAERLAGVEVGEVVARGAQLAQPGQQVVALDVGDRRRQPELVGDLVRPPRRSPAGSSPPALDTTLIPRSRQVPITCSIWVTKVRA